MNKKVKKLIMILFVVLVILLLTQAIIKTFYNNKKRTSEYIRPDVIQPMFSEKFFNMYKGEGSEKDILGTLSKFVYFIVDNKDKIDNLNEDSIKQEFLKDKEYYNSIGIQSEENFKNIMTKVKNIKSNSLNVSYTSFEIDTLTKMDGKYLIDFSIKFENVDEIKFKIEIEPTYNKDYLINVNY